MRKSARKKDTKGLIVQAALLCFGRKGVAQTTMTDVARAARIAQPLAVYHFPTPVSLHREVILLILEDLKSFTLQALEKKARNPKQALAAYVKAPFDWARTNPGKFSVWMYFYYQASFAKEFRELNGPIRKLGRERIATILHEGRERHLFSIPSGRDVRTMAWLIQSLITGGVIQARTENDTPSSLAARETVSAVLFLVGAP